LVITDGKVKPTAWKHQRMISLISYNLVTCQSSPVLQDNLSHHSGKLHLSIPNQSKVAYSSKPYTRGVQPFTIAGRITFISMKYGRQ